MKIETSRILERDARAKSQFERLSWIGLCGVLAAFLPLFVFQVIAFPSGSHFMHFTTFVFATISIFLSRDGLQKFMFSSVFFGFTWMLYLNASLQLKSIDFGIIDPIRAASISGASQLALTLVAMIDRCWPNLHVNDGRKFQVAQSFIPLEKIIFIILMSSFILDISGNLKPIYAESLRYLLPIFITLRFLKIGVDWTDVKVMSIVIISLFVAVLSNARSDFLNVLLALGITILLFSRGYPSLFTIFIFYCALRATQIFSGVILAVRPLRENPSVMLSETINRFFSFETFLSIVNPFFRHSSFGHYESVQTGVDYFTPDFFTHGASSIFDRLTLLPAMDVVTGRLDAPQFFDLSRLITNTFVSAMPNIGQTRIEALGDEIVWDLALRSRDTIGRPMITAQAEAWTIGGYSAVFAFTFAIFIIWLINYRIMKRFFALETLPIAIGSMVIVYSVFSTTLKSVTGSLWRMPLQTLVLLAILIFISRFTSRFWSFSTGNGR